MVCDLRLLFKPIPPLRADVRGEKKRVKWDGTQGGGARWSPAWVTTFLAAVGLAVAVGGVSVLLNGHSMHVGDAIACVVVWCLCCSAVLQFADQEPSMTSKAAIQSVTLLPLLFGIMLARPTELALATAAVAERATNSSG